MHYVNWKIVTPLTAHTSEGERTIEIHDSVDASIRQVDWTQAMNVPAAWIVFPVELAATKGVRMSTNVHDANP